MKGDRFFSFNHRGFDFDATDEGGGQARVIVRLGTEIKRDFLFPAYKVYNISAHADDIVDGLLENSDVGLRIAGSDGLGGNAYAPTESEKTPVEQFRMLAIKAEADAEAMRGFPGSGYPAMVAREGLKAIAFLEGHTEVVEKAAEEYVASLMEFGDDETGHYFVGNNDALANLRIALARGGEKTMSECPPSQFQDPDPERATAFEEWWQLQPAQAFVNYRTACHRAFIAGYAACRPPNEALLTDLRRTCWHADEGSNDLTCDLCGAEIKDGASQTALDAAHDSRCRAALAKEKPHV